MKVKIKKNNSDGLVKLESKGELKEVLLNEDFLHPEDASIALCFRGKDSSGIVELSENEIDVLFEELKKRRHLMKNIKVMKFNR
jgi:hypothetical protein